MTQSQPCPIGHLPVELLWDVLKLVLELHLLRTHPLKGVQSLRLVCKTWNEAIMSLPPFWSTVADEDHPEWVSTCLERSKEQVVDVTLELGQSEESMTSRAIIVSKMKLWHSLNLAREYPALDVPHEITEGEAPASLRRLWLKGHSRARALSLFKARPPRLEFLHLHQQPIPWNDPIILSTSLRTIHISHLDYSQPNARQIVRILAHCERLMDFALDQLQPDAFHSNHEKPGKPIILPCLKSLVLHIPLETLAYTLSAIQTPVCRRICLDWALWSRMPWSGPNLVTLLTHTAPKWTELASATSAPVIRVVHSDHGDLVGIKTADGLVSLKPRLGELRRCIASIPEICRTAPTTLMWSTHPFGEHISLEDLDTLLPNIVEISLSFSEDDTPADLLHLASKTSFRNLQRVEVKHLPGTEGLIQKVIECWRSRPQNARLEIVWPRSGYTMPKFLRRAVSQQSANVFRKKQMDFSYDTDFEP